MALLLQRGYSDTFVRLIFIVLTCGPYSALGIKAPYSKNAIVQPSPLVEEAMGVVKYRNTNDWTLTIVTPIALGIFFLIIVFFWYVVASDRGPENDQAEGFDYQVLNNEDAQDISGIEVVGGGPPLPQAQPHAIIDEIFDLPYTVPASSSSRTRVDQPIDV